VIEYHIDLKLFEFSEPPMTNKNDSIIHINHFENNFALNSIPVYSINIMFDINDSIRKYYDSNNCKLCNEFF